MTFPEVNRINDTLGQQGSVRAEKLSGDVAAYLADAEEAADAGRHAEAVQVLNQAKGKSHGLQDATLTAKIADLVEWQQGLIGF